jgi:hypothetical protein
MHRTLSLSFALIIGLAATAARADTVEYSQTVMDSDSQTQQIAGPTQVTVGVSLEFDVTLPQFNPALGTLTGVEIKVRSVHKPNPVGSITNNGAAPLNTGIGAGFTGSHSFPGGPGNGGGGGGGGPLSVGAGETEPIFLSPLNTLPPDGSMFSYGSPFDITPYQGAGTFNGTVLATSAASVSGPTVIPSELEMTASIDPVSLEFTVIYTFDPIPEPASAALLMLGGLALVRRRR